jgi:phosphatidylethanolamine/phosphatidyl-N-methylethanolamine N-methyltransferase
MTDQGPTVRDHLQLLGKFLRHPRTVGTIAPSSAVLAQQMVQGILPTDERIVELGPGTGSFTQAILGRLGPQARLLAVEIDPAFAAIIHRRWPQIDCVCASAEELPTLAAAKGFRPADRIISGLPFASLPEATTRGILDGIEDTLRPGGTFTTFQYVHAYRFPPGVTFRRLLTDRMTGPPTASLVLWNLPPAWVFTWQRPPATRR